MTNNTIESEFIDFKKYHKNKYNIYFHIVCGFIFMCSLFLLSKTYSNLLLHRPKRKMRQNFYKK